MSHIWHITGITFLLVPFLNSYSYTIRRGEFLQMSGVRVVYNLTQPSFARVHSVELLCADCDVPMYKPLDVFKQYKVVVGEFMSNGGHGYTMFTVVIKNKTLKTHL